MAMPHSGCGWEERWHTVPFSPGATAPLPPSRPTLPCSHTHRSVYWLMLSTLAHPLIGKTRLCQDFSNSVSLWASCKFCEETWWLAASWNYWWVLKEEVVRLEVMQMSTHIRTGLCRDGFLITIPKHFFVFCQMLTLMGERDCPWPNINIENMKSEKKTSQLSTELTFKRDFCWGRVVFCLGLSEFT